MFEVSTILDDDSAELLARGANRLANVSLLNSATSSLCGSSTFIELIRGDVVSLFGKVLGEGESLSMVVEEGDAPAVFGRSRVAAEIGVDTALRGGLADVKAAWFSTSPELMCPEVNP
ncbi:hypothetical protein Tco_1264173 [Tanacetum coccineum]